MKNVSNTLLPGMNTGIQPTAADNGPDAGAPAGLPITEEQSRHLFKHLTGAMRAPMPTAAPAVGGSAGVSAWAGGEDGMDALATLERHAGRFKGTFTRADLQKMVNDPATPPDLREALQTMLSTPGMFEKLESAKKGQSDGKLGIADILAVSQDKDLKAYNRREAQSFAANYIPSGDQGQTHAGRPITEADARNELYKFSDYLPNVVSLDELQKIVDGTSGGHKVPPQLKAAAQYYVQNPGQWKSVMQGNDRMQRADMLDRFSDQSALTETQRSALDRVKQDPANVFFKDGNITRKKLEGIAGDEAADPADRRAAQTLLDDPVLFGKLDNGKHGAHIRGARAVWLKSDDGQIGRGDLEGFERRLQAKGVQAAPASAPAVAKAPADRAAVADMMAGELDEPELKKAKGGGLRDVVSGLVKAGKFVTDIWSKVASTLGKIPSPLQPFFKAAAVGYQGLSGGLDVADKALNGGDVKKAAIKAGIDTAGVATDQVTNTSAGSTTAKVVQVGMWGEENKEKIGQKAAELA